MKPKFKGFAFVPLLIVLFLLIVSAVTSYLVINQGTGGYKSRADAGDDIAKCSARSPGYKFCSSYKNAVLECISYSVIPRTVESCQSGYSCFINKCVGINLSGICGTDGKACCFSPTPVAGRKYICSQGSPSVQSSSCRCEPTPAPKPCSKVGDTCCRSATTGKKYCDAASGLECYSAGTGLCRKPVLTPTPTPTDKPTGGGGGGGGGGGAGGGSLSCAGGVYCGGTEQFTGEAGGVYCGQADAGGICRSHRCNGSTGTFEYIGDACTYTSPETPPAVVPPTATGDVTLAMSLRLQGVTGNPRGAKTVPFKVKLKGPTSTSDYVTGTLTADSTGKWAGTVNFSGLELGSNVMYSVYVKVGKHLQKRVCVNSPTESPVGTYSCSDNGIVLTSGTNNLDFTNILQLVGDLPQPPAEQNGVVDSYDISYVLNHFGSTQTDQLNIGDLNFDGVIDTQDRSLIIQSLNVKYDDE